MDYITPALAAASIVASIVIWLSSAGARRTNERFALLENDQRAAVSEIKQLIIVGDTDEERRRGEALRDLDARTSSSISALRQDIKERFDDLKDTIAAMQR